MLKTIMANIARIESTVVEVDLRIEICIEPDKIKQKLLESIPWVGIEGATRIIAKVGVDKGQFPNQNHLPS